MLDNLDMKILSRLLNNCRESDRQIGKMLGISGGAVRVRIQKMEDKKIIEQFIVKIDPPVLGFDVLYIVVSGQNSKEILEQMKLVGEPFFLIPCVGGITVCSIVIKENLEQKIEFTKTLMKDVRILSMFKAENPRVASNLTKTDLEILEQLMREPRQKIEKLSGNTGLSTKTITRCMEKLHENKGIQFTVIYNPTKIENFIPYVILTWVEDNLKETLEEILENFTSSFIQIPFITKNQIVLFMYSDDIFKMDDLTQKIRNIDNVKTVDLFIPRNISFPSRWLKQTINNAKKSPTLHLMYHTN
jgi:DNA-binding Lrp family transcriptional regulator